jgi:hypothetical protein
MADPAFLEMRAGLVRRGLLTEDFSLTDAGCAHVDELIGELRQTAAPCDPDEPRVFWLHTFRQRRRAA